MPSVAINLPGPSASNLFGDMPQETLALLWLTTAFFAITIIIVYLNYTKFVDTVSVLTVDQKAAADRIIDPFSKFVWYPVIVCCLGFIGSWIPRFTLITNFIYSVIFTFYSVVIFNMMVSLIGSNRTQKLAAAKEKGEPSVDFAILPCCCCLKSVFTTTHLDEDRLTTSRLAIMPFTITLPVFSFISVFFGLSDLSLTAITNVNTAFQVINFVFFMIAAWQIRGIAFSIEGLKGIPTYVVAKRWAPFQIFHLLRNIDRLCLTGMRNPLTDNPDWDVDARINTWRNFLMSVYAIIIALQMWTNTTNNDDITKYCISEKILPESVEMQKTDSVV
jgi:uncharacterized membrane protein